MSQPQTQRERPVIAIDGPAGAGKSTMAAHLARRFGFLNLETGAMYRALALKAIDHDLGFDDEAALLDMATRHAYRAAAADGGQSGAAGWCGRLTPGAGCGCDRSGLADLCTS
jgi:cytidylate kinase